MKKIYFLRGVIQVIRIPGISHVKERAEQQRFRVATVTVHGVRKYKGFFSQYPDASAGA
jgi:16S rRNA G527 N7-methylase RsmG